MNHELRMELTRQLEKIKVAEGGPYSRGLFAIGTIAEALGGVAFIGWAIRFNIEERIYWVGYIMLFVGIVLLAQAAYLAFNRFMSRRLRILYEAILDSTRPADR